MLIEVLKDNVTVRYTIADQSDFSSEEFKTFKNIFLEYNVDLYYKENRTYQENISFTDESYINQDTINRIIKNNQKVKPEVCLKTGDVVGKCQIINFLEKGFTSYVYKAYHEYLDLEVALKILCLDLKSKNPEMEAIFLQEVKNTAKLKHDNLVRVFDAEKGEKYTYMVMEYIDGINLEHYLEKNKILSESQATGIMLKLVNVLNYALANKIIHRDIKPSNIMISKKSDVKLLDLGLSTMVNQDNLYKNYTLLGTPHYISPEQIIEPANVDHRSDMYSLGATFFHLLTGKPPFDYPTLKEVLKNKLSDKIDLKINRKDISPELKSLVLNLLKTNPDERIQNYEILEKELLKLKKKILDNNLTQHKT